MVRLPVFFPRILISIGYIRTWRLTLKHSVNMMKTCFFFALFVLALGQDNCDFTCPDHLDPVCGSDGVTYPNLCSLELADCLSEEDITVAHTGECESARESCDTMCTADYVPVCGSDGVTYSNLCNLELADCLSDGDIEQAYPGECKEKKDGPCDDGCPFNYDPVCGSDGVTYPNECALEIADCQSDQEISVAYPGECKSKRETCDLGCTDEYDPVCGSDGVTYPNECALEVADCQSDLEISVAYEGECKSKREECNMLCTTEYDPVCGSDGVTYSNLCNLENASCLSNEDITVAYPGECKACNTLCNTNYDPVCGTDGITYPNQCILEVTDCFSDADIGLAHTGPC